MPLLRGIARTAAIAGTATAVSNRVSRRQQNRWAQQEEQQYAQQPQYAPPPAAGTCARPHRTAEGARRAQVSGHPHRGRIRGSEGEGSGVLRESGTGSGMTTVDEGDSSGTIDGDPPDLEDRNESVNILATVSVGLSGLGFLTLLRLADRRERAPASALGLFFMQRRSPPSPARRSVWWRQARPATRNSPARGCFSELRGQCSASSRQP